ncbi:MAG: hypothetical protein ABIR92_02340 [Gemmatimonadaceae bacterium]
MNRIATSSLVGLAALVFAAADLSAQICNGTAPFSAGRLRAGAGIRMPNGGTIFDGEFAVGAASGLYGGATVSLYDPSGIGGNSTVVGGFVGKSMLVDQKKTLELCPQFFLQIGEQSTNSFGGGVTLGRSFKQSSFDIVPFGGAFLHRDDNGVTSDFNIDLQVGAGFVLNKVWTIRPVLNLPLTNNGDSVLGIMAFLNFGK